MIEEDKKIYNDDIETYLTSPSATNYFQIPIDFYKQFFAKGEILDINTKPADEHEQRQRLYFATLMFFLFSYLKTNGLGQVMAFNWLKHKSIFTMLNNITPNDVIPKDFTNWIEQYIKNSPVDDLSLNNVKYNGESKHLSPKYVKAMLKLYSTLKFFQTRCVFFSPDDLVYHMHAGTTPDKIHLYTGTFSYSIDKTTIFFTADKQQIKTWDFKDMQQYHAPDWEQLFQYLPSHLAYPEKIDSNLLNLEMLLDKDVDYEQLGQIYMKMAFNSSSIIFDTADNNKEVQKFYSQVFLNNMILSIALRMANTRLFLEHVFRNAIDDKFLVYAKEYSNKFSDNQEDFDKQLKKTQELFSKQAGVFAFDKQRMTLLLEHAPLVLVDLIAYHIMLAEKFCVICKLLLNKIEKSIQKGTASKVDMEVVKLLFIKYSTLLAYVRSSHDEALTQVGNNYLPYLSKPAIAQWFEGLKQLHKQQFIFKSLWENGEIKLPWVTRGWQSFNRYFTMFLLNQESKLWTAIQDATALNHLTIKTHTTFCDDNLKDTVSFQKVAEEQPPFISQSQSNSL